MVLGHSLPYRYMKKYLFIVLLVGVGFGQVDYSNFIGEWYMQKSEFAFNVIVGSDQSIINALDTINIIANVEILLPFRDDLDPDEENIFYTIQASEFRSTKINHFFVNIN